MWQRPTRRGTTRRRSCDGIPSDEDCATGVYAARIVRPGASTTWGQCHGAPGGEGWAMERRATWVGQWSIWRRGLASSLRVTGDEASTGLPAGDVGWATGRRATWIGQ